MKNVVICCDGTANEFSRHPTNVAKLFFTLPKGAAHQVCYYHPGVGTMAPPGFVTPGGARIAELLGMAFGYALGADIRDAYVFLADSYAPGDSVFFFGFSRGAYTVRALASMLRLYGLIAPNNAALVPYMVRMLWRIKALRRAERKAQISDYFKLAARFKATFSTECKPHFVGAWDTVSSVGWFTSPVAIPYTANNADVEIARHAISIDERRTFFQPNLWFRRPPHPGPRDLRQVWFPGCHGDVGGGHPEKQSGLSKITLDWIIKEAVANGLQVDSDKVDTVLGKKGGRYASPDPDACLHDSLTDAWKPLEHLPVPRWDPETQQRSWRANHGAWRTFPPRPVVHDAAWAREGGNYAARRLPADAIKLSEAVWDM
jgi:uncharacterized protein (DUF2235 family)